MLATAAVRREVLRSLNELRSAISERRIEGVLSQFAPDPDATLIWSSRDDPAQGQAEIRALFEELFASPPTFSWDWKEVGISSAGDVAWLWTEGTLLVDGPPGRPYSLSGILERRSGRWLWMLFHGSEPA